jgi:predicted transposase YbfD/YdcC
MQYSTLNFKVELPKQEIFFEVGSLYARLEELADKRDCRGRIYELAPIVLIALLAKLMGQNQLEAIAHWAKLRTVALCQLLRLEKERMPHHTTWGRILGEGLVVEELEELLKEFFSEQLDPEIPQRGQVVVSIDGKTLRGTIPKGQTQGVHLMAAYLPQLGVVLAQVAVERKENEIVAAPKVLQQLDLRGLVVTGDAMQTQRELSVEIVAGGGDYLWFVKGNQPQVLTDLEILFEPEPTPKGGSPYPTDFRSYRQIDKGHGRLEERVITVSSMLQDYTPWPHLAQAFKIEKKVWNLKGSLLYQEKRFGITSLPRSVATPKRLLEIARSEWSIENQLHWRRDVLFREDVSQLRRGVAPQVNAILNNLVLGLIALSGRANVAKARRVFEYDPSKALDLLFKPFLSNY